MEFLHKVEMQVREAFFVVCTPMLEIGVLDDKDHLYHERVKEGFSLLDVGDSTHDGAEVCTDLDNITHGTNMANAFDNSLALGVMGVRHKVILLVLCIGVSLDGLGYQVGVTLGSKTKKVDVSRLVVVASKLSILKTSVQNARREVLAEMNHRHVCLERVE
jgi:hypothetical protein